MVDAILIFSQNQTFQAGLAEQVHQELGLSCEYAVSEKEAFLKAGHCMVMVSDEPLAMHDWPCDVIEIERKPVRLSDLLTKIASVIQQNTEKGIVSVTSEYQLDCLAKRLIHRVSGRFIDITDKEMQLLEALAVAGGAGMSKEALLRQVWGVEAAMVDTHTLETHVYRLRGKLKELSGSDHVIIAEDGGYKITDYE